jgi:hypothetical protein
MPARLPVARSAAAALLLAAGLAASAGAQSRSPWQQHDGLEMTPVNPLGLVQLTCLPEQNGDVCEYDVSTIPPAEDAGWQPAPNADVIDFSVYPSRVCEAPVTCVDYASPENLGYVDFTYFQTFVDLPADFVVTRFTIDFDGMDDGSRVSVFNSDYPDGVVVPGSYVYYGETGTADLAALVRAGEVNRVVVTQVDDCCYDNQLRSATVVLNGETLAIVVDAFLLPSQVKFAPDAKDPAKGSFRSSGVLDTGSELVDLAGPGTLEIGPRAFPIPGLSAKGRRLAHTAGGVSFTVTPGKGGGSRGRYQLSVVGDLTDDVDPDLPLKLRFSNASVDARGEVELAGGRFKLGRTRGSVVEPVLYLEKVKAKLADAGPDSLKLGAGFATEGTTPDAPSDVHFAFGEAFAATVPASAFRRSKERWTGEVASGGGTLSLTLDYGREKVTVKARGVELGDFAEGPVPLRVDLSVGDEARGAEVRAVRSGPTLRY